MAAEPDDGAVGGTPAAGRGSVRNVLCGCLVGAGLLAAMPAPRASGAVPEAVTTALPAVAPREFTGDLSRLPQAPLSPAKARERPYRPLLRPPVNPKTETSVPGPEAKLPAAASLAPMPAPTRNFEGLARTDTCTGGQCGNGTPPDTNGEVGPNHYIQAVNSAYGIYDKNGTLLASFTEDQLWSGDASICNGQSQGDPVVVYDALADRWILTHFAFGFSGSNVTAPYYQCIAVSKTADPVAGGWWLYPVRVDDVSHPWLNDYGKFGIWTDCLYMSANEFTATDAYKGTLFASFSRADMYAGAPLTASIGYLTGAVRAVLDGAEPSWRPGRRDGSLRYAQLFRVGVADGLRVRGQAVRRRAELRRRRDDGRTDHRVPGRLHVLRRRDRAATGHAPTSSTPSTIG